MSLNEKKKKKKSDALTVDILVIKIFYAKLYVLSLWLYTTLKT